MESCFAALDDPEDSQPDAPEPMDKIKFKIECFLNLQLAAEHLTDYLKFDAGQTKDAYQRFSKFPCQR